MNKGSGIWTEQGDKYRFSHDKYYKHKMKKLHAELMLEIKLMRWKNCKITNFYSILY